jgi:hypothetical protein
MTESAPKFDLDNILRMPATLGPAPGPRNMPHSRQHLLYNGDSTSITVKALTDAARLSAFLPPRCRLAGEPVLIASITMLTNLGWLAGRGYNLVKIACEIIFDGEDGEVKGSMPLVLWENHADPILTGRDELGMTKLYCNIPNFSVVDGKLRGSADWEGFRFFNLNASDLQPADLNSGVQPYGAPGGPKTLCYRYQHVVGDWEKAAIAEMTVSTDGKGPAPVARERLTGKGSFSFNAATWEDMPTQYTFVTSLASLPLLEFRGTQFMRSTNIADLAAMKTIR